MVINLSSIEQSSVLGGVKLSSCEAPVTVCGDLAIAEHHRSEVQACARVRTTSVDYVQTTSRTVNREGEKLYRTCKTRVHVERRAYQTARDRFVGRHHSPSTDAPALTLTRAARSPV
jgi:hypothetical protein